jgi:hypothetical protein
MKQDEQIIGEAVRLEYEEKTGKLFIVFEIRDEKHKQDIRKNWVNDIEFRLTDKLLVRESK